LRLYIGTSNISLSFGILMGDPDLFVCGHVSYLNKLIWMYEGWNFNSGNYLFTTDTK